MKKMWNINMKRPLRERVKDGRMQESESTTFTPSDSDIYHRGLNIWPKLELIVTSNLDTSRSDWSGLDWLTILSSILQRGGRKNELSHTDA